MPLDRKIFQQHEKDLQDVLGLNSSIASGNQWHDIGDGSTGHNRESSIGIIIDCKSTIKGSYSLNAVMLKDWLHKAALKGKMFLLPVRFVNPSIQDYVVLELEDFLLLWNLAKKELER